MIADRHPLSPVQVELPKGGTTLALHNDDPFEVERAVMIHGETARYGRRCENCKTMFMSRQPADPTQPWTLVCSTCLHEQL